MCAAERVSLRDDQRLRRSRSLARWLDERYLDPIIGFLVPGFGDLITSAAGLYLVYAALRARVPKATLARMVLNVAFDAALGAVPFLGDLFDFVFRANRRNLQLLERYAHHGDRASRRDAWLLAGAFIVLLLALSLPVVLVVVGVRAWLAPHGGP